HPGVDVVEAGLVDRRAAVVETDLEQRLTHVVATQPGVDLDVAVDLADLVPRQSAAAAGLVDDVLQPTRVVQHGPVAVAPQCRPGRRRLAARVISEIGGEGLPAVAGVVFDGCQATTGPYARGRVGRAVRPADHVARAAQRRADARTGQLTVA